MIFVTKRIIPLLFVLILHVFNESVESRMKPILNVNGSQIIINEGETIELECTGDEGIVFYDPENNPQTSIPHLSPSPKNTPNDQKHRIKFHLNSTTFQNTGYYGCAYSSSAFKKNICNSSEASWIYVYVRSNRNLSLEAEIWKISGYINHTAVIPCRPTSPYYKVTLFYLDRKNWTFKEIQRTDEIIFDPKFGFTLMNLHMEHTGYYRCEFVDERNRSQACIFELRVYYPPRFEIKRASELAIEGQKFNLECKIHALGIDPDPRLGWIVPNGDVYQNSTSNKNRITSVTVASNTLFEIDGTSSLTIENLISSDEGNYTCALLINEYRFSSHTYLKVYDSNTQFIKLTSLNKTKNFDVCFGVTLVFAAKIDLHPDIRNIKVDWLRFGNEKITTSEEYDIIDGLRNFTQLTIKNVKKWAEESNLYTVRVSNSVNISATLDFLLQIWCTDYNSSRT